MVLVLIFLILFRRFWKIFFILFRRFSKQNRRKNVRSCEFFALPQAQHIVKIRKNVHFFLRFCFEKVEKEQKNFSKKSKKNKKKSTRTIKIYVLDQQQKKKIARTLNSQKTELLEKFSEKLKMTNFPLLYINFNLWFVQHKVPYLAVRQVFEKKLKFSPHL